MLKYEISVFSVEGDLGEDGLVTGGVKFVTVEGNRNGKNFNGVLGRESEISKLSKRRLSARVLALAREYEERANRRL